MEGVDSIPSEKSNQDDLYREIADTYSAALERVARAYEADPEKRRDLLQEIHFQVWRSLEYFNRQCSIRTWLYRVAHHTATSHVMKERRIYRALVRLEDLDTIPGGEPHDAAVEKNTALERLSLLIRKLKPLDRQIMVSYLEGMDAASIGEITGLSAGNVAMKIHRIKNVLARRFHQGGSHGK